MDLRITLQTQVARQTTYLRRQTDTLAQLQEKASTGLATLRPSDDPVATGRLMGLRGETTRRDAHQANVSTARTQLEEANSELLEVNRVFTRARQLTLDAASDGTDGTALSAIANEVDQLLERTLTLANARSEGRALFGGTATSSDPFVVTARDSNNRPTAVSYQGADSRATLTVGQDDTFDVRYTGEQVFQQSGRDVFQSLIDLRDLLRDVNGLGATAQRQALSQQVGAIESAQQAILDSVGEVSAGLESLEGLANRLGDRNLQTKTAISELESADLPTVAVQLLEQQNLFTATLQTAARVFDQNLLDFLR